MGMSPLNMDDADFDQLTFEIQLLIIGDSIYLHQYIHGLISTPKTLCMFQTGGEGLARYSIDIKWCH